MRLRASAPLRRDGSFINDARPVGDLLLARHDKGLLGLAVVDGALVERWRFDAPGSLTACAFGDPACVAWSEGWSKEDGGHRRFVAAVSAADGVTLWKRPLPKGFAGGWLAGDARNLYLSERPRLHVLDRPSGADRRVIACGLAAPPQPRPIPVEDAVDRVVLVGRGAEEIDAATGAAVWRVATAVPLDWTTVDGEMVYASMGGSIVAIDRARGAIAWEAPLGAWVGRPIPDHGCGALFACDADGALHALDAVSGAVRWTARGKGAIGGQLVGAPALLRAGGRAFIVAPSLDGSVYFVDAATGEALDALDTGEPLERAAVALPDGRVVALPMGGGLALVAIA